MSVARGIDDVAATPSQRARRERMLQAALSLALGGYDAVQMREVAERADVALGTLYRYFPSKVHLLVAAMGDELELLRDRARSQSDGDGNATDRVMEVVAYVTRSLARHRELSGALVRAVMFADGTVASDVDRVRTIFESVISGATHGVDEPPTDEDKLAAAIIAKVWLSDIVQWLGERMTLDEVLESLRATADKVLPR